MYAAGLFQEPDVGYHDVLLHGFAHVVNGERGGARCGERFHFHTGVPRAGYLGDDVNAAAGLVQREPDVNAVDQDRMACGGTTPSASALTYVISKPSRARALTLLSTA